MSFCVIYNVVSENYGIKYSPWGGGGGGGVWNVLVYSQPEVYEEMIWYVCSRFNPFAYDCYCRLLQRNTIYTLSIGTACLLSVLV